MKEKKYLWAVVIIIYLVTTSYLLGKANKTSPLLQYNLIFVFSLIFGILLKEPNILNLNIKSKSIKFDWTRFLIYGIPSFFLATPVIWLYTFNTRIFMTKLHLAPGGHYLLFLSSVWFGHVISSCIKIE